MTTQAAAVTLAFPCPAAPPAPGGGATGAPLSLGDDAADEAADACPLSPLKNLDGSAIRNANRGDSRESIHRKKNPSFITFEAVRAKCLKPAIRHF